MSFLDLNLASKLATKIASERLYWVNLAHYGSIGFSCNRPKIQALEETDLRNIATAIAENPEYVAALNHHMAIAVQHYLDLASWHVPFSQPSLF